VSVERVTLDARVLDRGRAVAGLGPEHFRVRIDDRPAALLSATWLPGGGGRPGPRGEPSSRPSGGNVEAEARPRGRRVVFFVQMDLHPSRAPGLLRLLREARRLVGRLGAADLAAVVGFDTHLELWQDLTSDFASVRRALAHDVLFADSPGWRAAPTGPSLGAHMDAAAMRRAASPETALRLVGEALRPVGGSKTLVFLGWGFGALSGPGVSFHADYDPARRALLESRVTVFTLDVTEADHHTLEVGLQRVARDTGGFYARTHIFTGQAMARLEEALAGHYVLEVAHPGGPRGRHELRVDLVGRRGEVLARSFYFD